MTYTPTEWQTGDIVTAEKLNNLENGVLSASGGGVECVTVTKGNLADGEETVYDCTTDKTFAELAEAYESGKFLVCKYTEGYEYDQSYTVIPLSYVSVNQETHKPSTFHFGQSDVEPSDSGISCVYIYVTISTIGAGVDFRNAQYIIERD